MGREADVRLLFFLPLALDGRQKLAAGSDRYTSTQKCRVAIGQETGYDSELVQTR